MSTPLEAALDYARRGWSVIPVAAREKRPAVEWEQYQHERASEEQIHHWWQENPAYNVGVVLGAVSGLVVVDVDSAKAAKAIRGLDPGLTPVVTTKRGFHWYYKHPGGKVSRARLLPGLTLLGDGNYVVAPPSVHPSGEPYRWLDFLSPGDVEPAPLPAWVAEKVRGQVAPEPETFTASALMSRTFPEPRWVVPGYLPEGLTLLAGRPKLGKSWLGFGLALAVASGGAAFGSVRVEQGESLYLALEDTPKRLQSRLGMMLHGEPAPDGLHLACAWPRLDQGGLQHLEAWLDEHQEARLLIVDTLQKLRPPQDGYRGLYEQDYAALAGLKQLADRHGVAVLVVHHLRKGSSEDPLEEVSGTTGLTGAADTVWVLRRDRGRMDASLFVTGRDVEEQEVALRFDPAFGLWCLLGSAEEYRMSRERQEIVALLTDASGPMRPRDIAATLNKNESTTRRLLMELAKAGLVKAVGRGEYIATLSLTTSMNNVNDMNNVNNVNNMNVHGRGIGMNNLREANAQIKPPIPGIVHDVHDVHGTDERSLSGSEEWEVF